MIAKIVLLQAAIDQSVKIQSPRWMDWLFPSLHNVRCASLENQKIHMGAYLLYLYGSISVACIAMRSYIVYIFLILLLQFFGQ